MATKTIKVPKIVDGVATGEVVDMQVDDYGASSWGPKDKHRLLNTRLPRVDAPAKSTGTAQYTHDVRLPGMLHGKFVTSPYAHAKITKFDASAALKIPGVKAVMPVTAQVSDPIVGQEIYYEGQPVAAVAAITSEIAEDAARAVVVEYQILDFLVTADDALKPGAPVVVPPAGGGRGGRGGGGRGGGNQAGTPDQADAALKTCDAVIEAEYRTPILHHVCLETHSAVADYNGGESAVVYVSTQGVGSLPREANTELGVPTTGICQNMGGGFGSKGGGLYLPGKFACRLAKQLKTPVKMVFTRREEFLAGGNGPGSIQKVKAGVTKDGTLVAMNVTQYSMAGIGGSQVAPLPYQYQAQTVYRTGRAVQTNEDSSVPLRAPGHPQSCFAMESLMDELAYKIGMDPVEFRKKNLPTAPAKKLDTETWTRQLDVGAKAIGWDKRNPTPGGGDGPLKRGMGCALGAWAGSGRGGSQVDLLISQDGSVSVSVGSQDLGTGTRTYVRAIAAEEFGLEMPDILEKIGNSTYGASGGSGGSTTAASLSPAVKDAAYNARVAFAKIIAPILGADPDAVWFDKRMVMGNGKAITWKQACAALPGAGLSAHGQFQQALAGGGAHGVSFAEVEVDCETGYVRVTKMCHVQDCGMPLNRLAIESQINGGMIQSAGMALYEGRIMDANLGVMVNASMNDYKLMGCREIPITIPIIDDGDTRDVVIGMAEPGNIPGCGAVANAVYNACGIRVRSTPITPDKILDGLAALKKA